LFLIGTSVVGWGQYDFPDYRNKKDNFLKMREKDIRADLASFTIAGIEESIAKLSLDRIPVTGYGSNYMIFEAADVKVRVTTGFFDPSKHKLGLSEKYLVKIDNKGYYGNYGQTPRTSIASVTVIVGTDTIPIPQVAFGDLYNPNFTYRDNSGVLRSSNGVYRSKDNHKLYIYLLTRDDSGSYEVTWVIQDKKYLRRVLDYGIFN
jgi:hypothetical protein